MEHNQARYISLVDILGVIGQQKIGLPNDTVRIPAKLIRKDASIIVGPMIQLACRRRIGRISVKSSLLIPIVITHYNITLNYDP